MTDKYKQSHVYNAQP